MDSKSTPGYKVWAVDGVVYGPVELPALINWVRDERVVSDTWIFLEHEQRWDWAAAIPELQICFRKLRPADPGSHPPHAIADLNPAWLRRVKVLADLGEQQLERFVQFMEVYPVRQWQEVVLQGQSGDAMYLVLEGELRVRLIIDGKESILATLGPGEFFGEIALFDHGARSADVIANKDSVLLRVSVENFDRLLARAPELAAPFMLSVGRTLVARIRADNKRFKDSIYFARTGGFSPASV